MRAFGRRVNVHAAEMFSQQVRNLHASKVILTDPQSTHSKNDRRYYNDLHRLRSFALALTFGEPDTWRE